MASIRPKTPRQPIRLILDSGAVIALARGESRARAFLAWAVEVKARIEIPLVVLAETIRGGARDAMTFRLLKAVGSVPEKREEHGRLAGELLGQARMSATIDALVVAQAIVMGGGVILTGDRDDLERLAAEHPEVQIRSL